MATPLTADQIVAAVRTEQISYREYPGWRTRGLWRSQRDGFDPRALTVHHTAGNLGGRSVEGYIRDIIVNDRAVPDKAQFVIAPTGVLWLVAAGRCNHMLNINQAGVDAISAADLPLDKNAGFRGDTSKSGLRGNRYAYGVEIICAGVPNAAQRETAVRLAVAISRAHGWSGRETHGHGEMSYDRSNAVGPAGDPGLHMGEVRRDVMAQVKKAAGATPAAAKATVSLKALQEAAKQDGPRKQGGTTAGAADDVLVVEKALQRLRFLDGSLVDGSYGTSTVEAYRRWQEYRGSDPQFCDGIPGAKDLAALATYAGFKAAA